MKIVSCNILAQAFYEEKWYPLVSKKIFQRSKRFKLLANILINHNADVYLLQEVMPLEHYRLKKLFEPLGYYVSNLIRIRWGVPHGISGNIIIIRNSLIHDKNDTKLFTTYPLPLDKSYNNLAAVLISSSYCFVSVHLSDLSTFERIRQIKVVINHIKATYPPSHTIIIGGDFNEAMNNSRLHKYLLANGYNTQQNIKCPSYMIEAPMLIDFIYCKNAVISSYKVDNKCYTKAMNKQDNKTKKQRQECVLNMYGTDHTPIVAIIKPSSI